MRGPGETEIETDRRIVRDKITLLKKKLLVALKQIRIQKTVLFEFVNNYFALVRNAPETPLQLMKSRSDPSETALSRAVLYCVLNPDQFWTH